MFAILAGYAGIDGWDMYQDSQTSAVNITVEREATPQKNYTPEIKATMQAHIREFH